MSKETEKLRVIYQLLFDLATGERLAPLGDLSNKDVYSNIHRTLYALGVQLRDLVLASGMVPTYANFEHISAYVFVLDASHRLIDFNTSVAKRLGYTSRSHRYLKFETLLTSDSALRWYKELPEDYDKTSFFVTLELVFVAKDGALLPLYCTVSKGLFEDWVFVLSVEVHIHKLPLEEAPKDSDTKDLQLVEQVHHYILEHLNKALPSARALAMHFGVEEHYLRSIFKVHYGISIYQFYQTKRLKKGYQLILTTQLPLKDIADECGFSTYLNFYKAFKKAYGIAPSVLVRPK